MKTDYKITLHASFIAYIVQVIVPIMNACLFASAPIYSLHKNGETGFRLRQLFSKKIFFIMIIMMLCAGTSEQAVSQWASAFAEQELGISKTIGDLAGPMAFAALMGTSRLIYGIKGDKLNFLSESCGRELSVKPRQP